MSKGSGVSRGDRRRNARLAELRLLVCRENAIAGIDLAEDNQAVVVTDHDSKVLARRSPRCKAWQLGEVLDWAVGKAKAMDVILTGRNVTAREAEAHGLVTQLVPREAVVTSALELAARIAAMPPLAVMAAKEAVNRAFELSLEAGLEFERRNFFLLFGSEDQREGMAAFVEKRAPEFKGR